MKKPKPTRKKPPQEEDEAQSRRFLELGSELEAAGELSPTDDGNAFERAMDRITARTRVGKTDDVP